MLALGRSFLAAAPTPEPRRRPPVRSVWLPGGDVGVLQTVGELQRMARASVRAPSVQHAAAVATAGATDVTAQWRALRTWLTTHTQFLADPVGIELVRTPHEQLVTIARDGVMRGDCDDVAVLAAAMTRALGAPARFAVLGFGAPGPRAAYRHIYAEMQTAPGVWRDFDVTRRPDSLPASRRMTVLV